MANYYFDLREGDELIADEEGLNLRDMRAVQKEAARLGGICMGQRGKLQRRTKPSNGNRGARRRRPCDGGQVFVRDCPHAVRSPQLAASFGNHDAL
jgi:hypothetical protein